MRFQGVALLMLACPLMGPVMRGAEYLLGWRRAVQEAQAGGAVSRRWQLWQQLGPTKYLRLPRRGHHLKSGHFAGSGRREVVGEALFDSTTGFEPWPYWIDVWGFPYLPPRRQPVRQRQATTKSERWESWTVFDGPSETKTPAGRDY